MIFNSLTFPIFFCCVLAVHYGPFSWSLKKYSLLIASYLFYGAWNPVFTSLLALSTVIDWVAARAMARAIGRRRKLLLLTSLVSNLGLLALFKYGAFIMRSATDMADWLGGSYEPLSFDLLLPVGISFYTFQTLSYTIDVYRRDLEAERSFSDFALFVAFFPQLVAGPIVRASDFLPQLKAPTRATSAQFGWGLTLVVFGIFEKAIIADTYLAPAVDSVFSSVARPSTVDSWIGTLAFSGQIFCDFAGYSLCAIGVSSCLGFALPDNFRAPYASIGFSEFWQRWHMSLSTWLRDYLYIPLGGNRRGKVRTYINLTLTMLLGGLWHGAAWTFVIWGGLHGLYLIGERWLRGALAPNSLPPALRFWGGLLVTYLLTCLAWVFFRAPDFATAWRLLTTMLTLTGGAERVLTPMDRLIAPTVIAILLAVHIYLRQRTIEATWQRLAWPLQAVLLAGALLALLIGTGNGRAFIYFQF